MVFVEDLNYFKRKTFIYIYFWMYFLFSYTPEAPEMQMRRLADLAFMFQLYDLAYQTYHTAKRDFNTDHAWLYYAGALVSKIMGIQNL